MTFRFTFLSIICFLIVNSSQAVEPKPLKDYLEFSKQSAEWTWEHKDSIIDSWRENFDPDYVWGYFAPPKLIEMTRINAALFSIENDDKYAQRAKEILLTYRNFRDEYPEKAAAQRPDYESGVPPLPDFFNLMLYIRAYDMMKDKGIFDKAEKKIIEETVAASLDYQMRIQEWGPTNRAILRAECFAWALRAFPDHPKATKWKIYEQAAGGDNWGNWQIEDAAHYHAVWLYSMTGYAEANDRLEELFQLPEMHYYDDYFLNLMCPAGMIPDFGDSYWMSYWYRFLAFFETAANQYDDPELKWAASVIADTFFDTTDVNETQIACTLLDCYRLGSDEIQPRKPDNLSTEVMGDLVGKKVVFRDGWDANSTYMLLNYRDEGDGGMLFRNYLRDTYPTEEEKMVHGHADENSIAMLMYGGSILLHDGGYREYMPSGPYGAYRADYFHNRMCVRPEKIWMGQEKDGHRYSPPDNPEIPGQKVLEFLHNSGACQPVRTQKTDFMTFDEFDYSRTRLIHERFGYQWDRAVIYVKETDMFIVFDIVKANERGYLTACNLWHTRGILAQGEHWYDTRYDSLGSIGLQTDNNLLIYFPKTHFRLESVEDENRFWQKEKLISQYTGQHFELGRYIGFVTVLAPHSRGIDPKEIVQNISYFGTKDDDKGMAVEIKHNDKVIKLGVKCELRMDIVRDYRRPKYTYEAGKMQFGKLETNGDLFFTVTSGNKMAYTIINFSKAYFDGKELFVQKEANFGLSFDGKPDRSGRSKVRFWQGEIEIE